MRHDILADALVMIKNAEKVGKKECVIPASKLVKAVLKILHSHGYINSFEFIDDGKGGKFRVELKGRIIECKAIKPRFSTKVDEFEKFEKRFLPTRDFGILIISTSKGIMDHKKARELKLGGKLLAYCY
ncbi:MAG: 30S ribosomal protein S8 [Candidatus Aenigmatarchaeota archaeon]